MRNNEEYKAWFKGTIHTSSSMFKWLTRIWHFHTFPTSRGFPENDFSLFTYYSIHVGNPAMPPNMAMTPVLVPKPEPPVTDVTDASGRSWTK